MLQYEGIKNRRIAVDPRFDGGYPEWKLLDYTLTKWPVSIAWGTLYTLFYVASGSVGPRLTRRTSS